MGQLRFVADQIYYYGDRLPEIVGDRTARSTPVGPSERLTVEQALRAMITNAAWQLGVEAHRGSLEPGKAADLVMLSRSPLETSPDALD